jgi:cytidylate kinase
VRVAFAGKGGSGKTTLSSLFVRHLAAQGLRLIGAGPLRLPRRTAKHRSGCYALLLRWCGVG